MKRDWGVLLGLVWVSANVWRWLPYHIVNYWFLTLLELVIVVGNLALFCLTGYLGYMRRDILMFVWPVLVLVSPVLGFAMGLAAMWGWELFGKILFGALRQFLLLRWGWPIYGYMAFCIVLFLIGFYVAALRKSQSVTKND